MNNFTARKKGEGKFKEETNRAETEGKRRGGGGGGGKMGGEKKEKKNEEKERENVHLSDD